MSRQRESKLSGKIAAELRARGAFVFKVHGSEAMMAGLPDLVVCYRGLFLGIETKMPESRDNVSKIQAHRHREIREASGVAVVVCSVNEAVSLLRQLDQLLSLRDA